jgi:hypothetical protein
MTNKAKEANFLFSRLEAPKVLPPPFLSLAKKLAITLAFTLSPGVFGATWIVADRPGTGSQDFEMSSQLRWAFVPPPVKR